MGGRTKDRSSEISDGGPAWGGKRWGAAGIYAWGASQGGEPGQGGKGLTPKPPRTGGTVRDADFGAHSFLILETGYNPPSCIVTAVEGAGAILLKLDGGWGGCAFCGRFPGKISPGGAQRSKGAGRKLGSSAIVVGRAPNLGRGGSGTFLWLFGGDDAPKLTSRKRKKKLDQDPRRKTGARGRQFVAFDAKNSLHRPQTLGGAQRRPSRWGRIKRAREEVTGRRTAAEDKKRLERKVAGKVGRGNCLGFGGRPRRQH